MIDDTSAVSISLLTDLTSRIIYRSLALHLLFSQYSDSLLPDTLAHIHWNHPIKGLVHVVHIFTQCSDSISLAELVSSSNHREACIRIISPKTGHHLGTLISSMVFSVRCLKQSMVMGNHKVLDCLWSNLLELAIDDEITWMARPAIKLTLMLQLS